MKISFIVCTGIIKVVFLVVFSCLCELFTMPVVAHASKEEIHKHAKEHHQSFKINNNNLHQEPIHKFFQHSNTVRG